MNKEIKNAGWLIGGKFAQMLLSLAVGVLTARYLGPNNYGTISYVSAYVSFFTSFCTLGINSIIIKDFLDYPKEQGIAIGSAILSRVVSSMLSILMIVGIVSIVDAGDKTTIFVSFLCSISLLFQVFDTINYWFQSHYHSKTTSIATLVAYIIVSIYKIILLVLKKDIRWFAFSTSVDYIAIATFLLVAYRKSQGPSFQFSFAKAKSLLSNSHHYILSGMMVAIYGQTDKLMLKHMLSETEVGYYSIAMHICSMWVFILVAIIDSMYPTILRLFKEDQERFNLKNKQMYAIIFYISTVVSVGFTLIGGMIVKILYGNAYAPAAGLLKIITWYTAFSYLGVARNAWLVCEKKQKYLKYMYFGAAVLNILMNSLLIPQFGASGAAVASLITQIFTSIILPFVIPALRPNAKLMIESILLQGVIPHKYYKS